jgi:hypothetical protein
MFPYIDSPFSQADRKGNVPSRFFRRRLVHLGLYCRLWCDLQKMVQFLKTFPRAIARYVLQVLEWRNQNNGNQRFLLFRPASLAIRVEICCWAVCRPSLFPPEASARPSSFLCPSLTGRCCLLMKKNLRSSICPTRLEMKLLAWLKSDRRSNVFYVHMGASPRSF